MKTHLSFVCLALLLTACSTPPKTNYYTLSAALPATAPASASAMSVIVGPVFLPEMLDQPSIVVQRSSTQINVDDFHRWAGSLKNDIARVIVANLVQDLGTVKVWSYAQSTETKADIQVLIDVQAFDAKPGKEVVLDLLWTVRPAAGGASKTGRSLVREPVAGTGFDPLVAAHSRALAQASKDIAKSIQATR